MWYRCPHGRRKRFNRWSNDGRTICARSRVQNNASWRRKPPPPRPLLLLWLVPYYCMLYDVTCRRDFASLVSTGIMFLFSYVFSVFFFCLFCVFRPGYMFIYVRNMYWFIVFFVTPGNDKRCDKDDCGGSAGERARSTREAAGQAARTDPAHQLPPGDFFFFCVFCCCGDDIPKHCTRAVLHCTVAVSRLGVSWRRQISELYNVPHLLMLIVRYYHRSLRWCSG